MMLKFISKKKKSCKTWVSGRDRNSRDTIFQEIVGIIIVVTAQNA